MSLTITVIKLFPFCRALSLFCFCFVRGIFWITILYQMCFANIFSQSVGCLLILFTLPFTEQMFFILMKSSSSIISLTDHALGVVSKKKITIPKGIWVLSCVLPSGDVGAVIFWLMWKEAEGSEQGPFLNHSAQLTRRSPDRLCAWHTRALGLQSRAPRPWRTPFYRTKLIK